MKRLRPTRLFLRLTLGLVAMAFVVGAAFWSARLTLQHLREDLLHHTRMAALGIDSDLAAQLNGSSADLGTPAYQHLKEQLAEIHAAHSDSRFTYLMGRKPDGNIFFFVDNEPDESEDCSPPGQVYEEASPELIRLFTTRKELVEGPLKDRWGNWVSAATPLSESSFAGAPIYLGMDVDARYWRQNILVFAALPAGLALLVGLLGLLAVWLQQSRRRIRQQQMDQQNLLQKMITSFSVYDAVLDPQGNCIDHRFVLINDAFEKSANVRRKDVIGKTIQEIWPDTAPAWFEVCKEVSMNGVPKDFEMFHAPTGRFFHCSIYRPDAASPRICVFSEDITQRHKTEMAFKENEAFALPQNR